MICNSSVVGAIPVRRAPTSSPRSSAHAGKLVQLVTLLRIMNENNLRTLIEAAWQDRVHG